MSDPHRERLRTYAERWSVVLDESILETRSALVAFGRRGDDPVVLKIIKSRGDEWRSGLVVRAFGGGGMVRALEYDDGAVLLERLMPGSSLVDVVRRRGDDAATSIIGNIIRELSTDSALDGTPTVEDWGAAFERYRETGDGQIPESLVDEGGALFAELCATQRNRRLLHGDLQHTNILFDDRRGWTAIDPKGVIGDPEFEVYAFARNPPLMPHLYSELATLERRLRMLCAEVGLDYERALRWVFAGAVLSAIWGVEDDGRLRDDDVSLTLACTVRPAIT